MLFDYFAKTAVVLEKGQEYSLTLNDYDDFRLFFLLPFIDNVVPFGLLDKYMSPATFDVLEYGKWLVHEGGTFCLFSESGKPTVKIGASIINPEPMGDMLYTVDLPDHEMPIIVELV